MKRNKFFDVQHIKEESEYSECLTGAFSTYLNHQLDQVDNVDDLVRMPAEGEVFFLHTEKEFSIFTFVLWVSRRLFIDELFISSGVIGIKVVESLLHLHKNGRIGSIRILIHRKEKTTNSTVYQTLKSAEEDNSNISVITKNNNSKVGLIKAGEFHLVLEGSGEWDDIAVFNQFILTNQEQVYKFRKRFFI
ncbi:hypothetical protein ACVVIH_06845 [Chryseobacterium arthrosphaerae]